jgi:TRAP-type C4-dicarboxylate transport system permease small subunit
MEIIEASWFTKSRNFIHLLSRWSEWVGLVAIAAMVLTTLIDVVGSKWFQWPLPGSTELTGILQVVAIAGGLAFSKIDGRHIRVDFLIDCLPQRGKAVLEVFISVLGLGFFAVAGWMTYQYGVSLFSSGTETLLLGIPLSPFSFWIAFCCIPMCCVIIIELLSFIDKLLK